MISAKELYKKLRRQLEPDSADDDATTEQKTDLIETTIGKRLIQSISALVMGIYWKPTVSF